MDDDDLPRRRGDAASQLSLESLDSYSQDELDERVGLLEAEIVRVKAHRDRASAHRLAADALFKPRAET
ncbi:MAG: DUF1192 domain-containing protein [Novosphingobium sp.]|nr:DUF1192 domain-containing protein [Novosphingobium sp.]